MRFCFVLASGQYEVVKLPSSEDQLSSYYPAPQDYSQQQSNDVEMEVEFVCVCVCVYCVSM